MMGRSKGRGTGRGLALTAGTKQAQLRKAGAVRWTAAKTDQFFEVLAATCNISEACRRTGLGDSQAYRRRSSDAEFRRRWSLAIDEAHSRLQLMLLERMMNGTVKQVIRGDTVFDLREYSNSVALGLLKAHQETADAAAIEAEMPEEEIEAVRARILRKLKAVRARITAGEAAPAGEAQ